MTTTKTKNKQLNPVPGIRIDNFSNLFFIRNAHTHIPKRGDEVEGSSVQGCEILKFPTHPRMDSKRSNITAVYHRGLQWNANTMDEPFKGSSTLRKKSDSSRSISKDWVVVCNNPLTEDSLAEELAGKNFVEDFFGEKIIEEVEKEASKVSLNLESFEELSIVFEFTDKSIESGVILSMMSQAAVIAQLCRNNNKKYRIYAAGMFHEVDAYSGYAYRPGIEIESARSHESESSILEISSSEDNECVRELFKKFAILLNMEWVVRTLAYATYDNHNNTSELKKQLSHIEFSPVENLCFCEETDGRKQVFSLFPSECVSWNQVALELTHIAQQSQSAPKKAKTVVLATSPEAYSFQKRCAVDYARSLCNLGSWFYSSLAVMDDSKEIAYISNRGIEKFSLRNHDHVTSAYKKYENSSKEFYSKKFLGEFHKHREMIPEEVFGVANLLRRMTGHQFVWIEFRVLKNKKNVANQQNVELMEVDRVAFPDPGAGIRKITFVKTFAKTNCNGGHGKIPISFAAKEVSEAFLYA